MASTRQLNQSVKLTKTVVDRLAPPATGQAFVRDALLKGFAVRITAKGVRSFILEKRIDGRVKRDTLGRYGELTVEQARRKQHAVGAYVFPGEGRQGYLIEPKRQIAKVIEGSGISFTIHDLRRTFITIAESIDIPPYAIKRLVNHKTRGDVTAGYIVADVERLREPVRRLSDALLRATGAMASPPNKKLP